MNSSEVSVMTDSVVSVFRLILRKPHPVSQFRWESVFLKTVKDLLVDLVKNKTNTPSEKIFCRNNYILVYC